MARWRQSAEDRERGAMAVIVGVLLLAIVAMGLVVYEVGAVVLERRQLQNAADAAVLAVAADCIEGTGITSADCAAGFDADATAKQYIDANADGRTLKDALEWDPPGYPAQSVRAVAWSRDDGGGTFLTSVFNADGWVREASAVARWGGIAAATAIPLALPECAFMPPDALEGGETLLFVIKKGGVEADDSCDEAGPGGAVAPGNFRWLESEGCLATTEAGEGFFIGDPGNAIPTTYGCDPSDFAVGLTIVFAMYDEVTGQGGNTQLHIVGYAALEITNFKLHGNPNWHSGFSCPGGPEVLCLEGKFVEFVEPDAPIGENDFGVRSFALVG